MFYINLFCNTKVSYFLRMCEISDSLAAKHSCAVNGKTIDLNKILVCNINHHKNCFSTGKIT